MSLFSSYDPCLFDTNWIGQIKQDGILRDKVLHNTPEYNFEEVSVEQEIVIFYKENKKEKKNLSNEITLN